MTPAQAGPAAGPGKPARVIRVSRHAGPPARSTVFPMGTSSTAETLPASVRDVMGPWAQSDRVPMADLARTLGVTRKQRQDVLDEGLVTPLGRAGRGGSYVIGHEDAVRFATAALIALAAGVALVAILRVLSGTGASISSAGVTIPLAAGP